MDPDAPIDVPATLLKDPGSDLLSTYWPAAVGLLLVLVTVVLAVRAARQQTGRRGPRSRRRRAWGAGGWSLLGTFMLVLALALGVNTWVGYFPSTAALSRWVDDKVRPPAAEFPTAAIVAPTGDTTPGKSGERVTTSNTGYAFLAAVPSTSAKVPNSGAWVYLPPDYDAPGNTTRYPVMYVLHGSPGSAADWFAGGRLDYSLDTLIAAGDIPPMIVVSPDLNAGSDRIDDEPLDVPGGPQIENYVTKDAVQWADSNFRTQADAAHRIVGGMSSGGLASLLYGLHHPDLFGGVVSIMPYTHPYTRAVKADPTSFAHNSPLDVIAARTGATSQKIFLGQGNGEPANEATAIRDALRAQGQTTTLRVLPDMAHSWTTARTIMPYGLIWVSQELGWVTPGS